MRVRERSGPVGLDVSPSEGKPRSRFSLLSTATMQTAGQWFQLTKDLHDTAVNEKMAMEYLVPVEKHFNADNKLSVGEFEGQDGPEERGLPTTNDNSHFIAPGRNDGTKWNKAEGEWVTQSVDRRRFFVDAALIQLLEVNSLDHKINLLIFLQEHCLGFFHDVKILWCFFNTMKVILAASLEFHSRTDSIIQGQVLVTATAIILEICPTPNAKPDIFKSFVGVLVGVIRGVHGRNSYVRQMACECLREVEYTFPGVLSCLVSDILGESSAEQ